jgi:HJR/Mrr/RecB family endonuclease
MTRIGGLANLVVVSSALALIFTSLLGLPTTWRIGITLVGAAMAAYWGTRLIVPSDDEIASRINCWEQELDGLSLRRGDASQEALRAREAFQVAEAHYLRLLEAHNSRINQLLDCHWQGMAGVEFEDFLAAVFQELGYRVETTKVTGDQGVDLIVSKDGRKVAIQAKGYPGTTVGNKAVQEAHTGMTFYGCQAAVVITNSTYTSGARELAAKVGSILIERNQIPDLIEGRLRI